MPEKLSCIPLKSVTDGPLFGVPSGTLSALQNMRLRPDGYAEARGGMEKLKPSAGTAGVPVDSSNTPITSGGTPAGIQVSSSTGWIVSYESGAGSFSANRQFSAGNWQPFAGGSLNNALYFGADAPFGRVGIKLQVSANWIVTLTYEYWNGAWTALTTQETITWTVTTNAIDSYASWQIPSDWTASVPTGTWPGVKPYKYWMRIRVSAFTSVTTEPRAGQVFGSWVGTRELYLISQKPFAAGPNGVLQTLGQNGANGEYVVVTGALYSAPDSIPSMSAYRGRVIFTEPKETKRYDGEILQNVGNAAPATAGSSRAAGAGIGAGIWRHYIAWGYGPLQTDLGNTLAYMTPSYGVSQATLVVPTANADPNDTNSIQTTAGNERVTVDWTAISIPSDASSIIIYRTQDLTNVNIPQRSSIPAYPIFNRNRNTMTTTTTVTEQYFAIDGAPQAVLYDNLPPKNCRFCFVFENRLFLGGGPESTWYWSDPFLPDQFNRTFNYISLVRAQGGRDMGGVEFGEQAVLFTEDQTWGLQNPGFDVPNLYSIHPAVGCIAPNSISTGDGVLIWLSKDGVYLWDGSKGGPKNVSGRFKHTFRAMNFENHGGSRGLIYDHKYDLTLVDGKNGVIGTAYTLDLETLEWSTRTTNDKKIPLCAIHAPLGHADSGAAHALYAKATIGTSSASDATSYSPCVADYTTQDDGTNYVCSASMVFPLAPGVMFKPSRAIAYYQAADGWATPTMAYGTTLPIGSSPGTLNTGTPDTADDYSVVGATFSSPVSGTSDIEVTFSATSQVSGTVGRQRLFGGIVEGEYARFRRGGV